MQTTESVRAPLWKITLRGIRTQFGRFLMTILAVLVGTSFLTSVLGLREVLSSVFTSITSASVVYDFYIQGPKTSSSTEFSTYGELSIDVVDEISSIDGVRDAQIGWSGSGLLYDSQGNLRQDAALIQVTATQTGSSGPNWVEGQAPAQNNEIAIEQSAAQSLEIKVGDQLTVLIGASDGPQTLTVSGIFAYDTASVGIVSLFISPDYAQTVFNTSDTASMIWANGPAGASEQELQELKNTIAAALADNDATVMTGSEYADYLQAQVDTILGFVTTFLLVFIAVAIFVSTFIIYNTFQMSVRARQHEWALLRTVGVAPKQIFLVVACQAVVIGLFGGILGIFGGIGLNQLTGVVFEAMGMALSDQVPLTWPMIAISLSVAVLVTLFSSLLPARRASKTAPVEAMRDAVLAESQRLTGRIILGCSLVLLGALGITTGINRLVPAPGWALGIGALFLLIGILALSPALVRPMAHLICFITKLFSPATSQLTVRNIVRHPRRMSVTSGALIVCITLVTMGASLGRSTQESVAGILEETMLSDLVVSSQLSYSIPSDIQSQIAALDGVERVDSQVISGLATYTLQNGKQNTTYATALDASYVGEDLLLAVTDGGDNPLQEGQVAIHTQFASLTNLSVGDQITLEIEVTADYGITTESQTFTVGAIYTSGVISSMLTIPYQAASLLQNQLSSTLLFVDVADDTEISQVKAEIQDLVRSLGYVMVGDQQDYASQSSDMINRILVSIYALLGLSLVVAAIGIVNTLVLSVSERTREFGLLRAVGLSRSGLASMIVIESVVTTVFGAILGIITGLGLTGALTYYLSDAGLTGLTIPWNILALTLVGAIVLGALAAIIPALRAARIPVLTAIDTQ